MNTNTATSVAQAIVVQGGGGGDGRGTGAGAYGGGGGGVGTVILSSPGKQSVFSSNTSRVDMYTFTCTKVENGWVLGFGTKKFICNDLTDMSAQFIGALVADRLERP